MSMVQAGVQWENFLKERYRIDDTFFYVYDTYTPRCRPALTNKFYSKYEQLDLSQADERFMKLLKREKVQLPTDKYDWPVTASQWYGWFSEPFVPMDKTDERFYFPALMSPETRHEIFIKIENKKRKGVS